MVFDFHVADNAGPPFVGIYQYDDGEAGPDLVRYAISEQFPVERVARWAEARVRDLNSGRITPAELVPS